MRFFRLSLIIAIFLFGCKMFPRDKDKPLSMDAVKVNSGEDTLSIQEAKLLNSFLKKSSQDTVNFTGKKVVFITGSSGNRILSKSNFFDTCINPWIEDNEVPQLSVVFLTQPEKEKSGGYDMFVLSWVKYFSNRQKNKIIEQLAKNKRK